MRYLTCLFALLISSCATVEPIEAKKEMSASYPFQARTLEFSNTETGLVYPYRVCAKKFLGICTSWVLTQDIYDLNDPVIRKAFVDGGWTCAVEVKP